MDDWKPLQVWKQIIAVNLSGYAIFREWDFRVDVVRDGSQIKRWLFWFPADVADEASDYLQMLREAL